LDAAPSAPLPVSSQISAQQSQEQQQYYAPPSEPSVPGNSAYSTPKQTGTALRIPLDSPFPIIAGIIMIISLANLLFRIYYSYRSMFFTDHSIPFSNYLHVFISGDLVPFLSSVIFVVMAFAFAKKNIIFMLFAYLPGIVLTFFNIAWFSQSYENTINSPIEVFSLFYLLFYFLSDTLFVIIFILTGKGIVKNKKLLVIICIGRAVLQIITMCLLRFVFPGSSYEFSLRYLSILYVQFVFGLLPSLAWLSIALGLSSDPDKKYYSTGQERKEWS